MDYKNIIESRYNREAWQLLLHDIFHNKVNFWRTPSEVRVSSRLAKQALNLGKISLADGESIAIYEVELTDNVDIERNRRGIRDMLTTDWRNMGYAGAFMFCYRQNESVLRFSYVSESWSFNKEGEYKKDSTDTRRFTYLLGEGHRSRTAIQQFEGLRKSNLTLKDLTKAFSVDAVGDMFFADYKQQYEDILAFITGKRTVKKGNKWEEKVVGEPNNEIMSQFAAFGDPEKAVRDYVKKLMGRLVFLQFLQKKGWLGVPKNGNWGDGDREFVQHLFANCNNKDHFIDDVLEPLFNDINTEREDDVVSAAVGIDIRVPYLNGGLFEPDAADAVDFLLPAKYMKSMLDFFASYNFTIDENDPDDAEMGVDPEMLGRIFENLLEDNKDKGAFYTPKEIVTYMCRESLIAYLQTDIEKEVQKEAIRQFVTTHKFVEHLPNEIPQLLKDVKICDPAIGSGAFPMGLLKELFLCRSSLEGFDPKKSAEIKKHIIQQNIYGVDIEKGAVDIARLRFWLSLIVDEETPEALPNLDFKIMQGNSLLEQYKGIDLSNVTEKKADASGMISIFDDMLDVYRKELREKLEQYYNCANHKQKIALRSEIAEIVKKQIHEQGCDVNFGDIDLSGNDQFFLWHTWFHDVFSKGGFDIVIGNPPYIKEYTNRSAFDGFRESSPYYIGKMDLWHGFACHGLDLANAEGGVLCFIAQNNWTTNAGAKLLRNKVVNECRIVKMLDFNDFMVFGDSASIQTMVMLFVNDKETDDYALDFRRLANGTNRKGMIEMINGVNSEQVEYLNPIFNRDYFNNGFITFSPLNTIIEKIAKDKLFLEQDEAINGIHPHYDFVDKKINRKHPNTIIGEGIFGLSDKEKEELNLTLEEDALIKPYFSTEEVKRYYTKPNHNLWIIYTDSSFKNPDSMNCYPHLKAHLDKFKDVITSDNKPYGLHRARKIDFFNGEKIIVQRKCVGKPSFSYSEFPCYVSATFYIIKTVRWNMKFLTGLLNSKLVQFWLKHKGKMQGENYQVDKEPLINIPLPQIDVNQTEIIVEVNNILSKLSKNIDDNISVEESKINQIVYNIYGLTSSEIELLENDLNPQRQ